jgi:hypothetical protein
MPASLYRLANKPHYTEAHESTNNVVAELNTQPVTVEEPVSAVSEELAVEPAKSDDPPSTPEPVSVSQAPAWDPGWTKTQLLEVATRLGLEVTSSNSKVQIIEALTAATSS